MSFIHELATRYKDVANIYNLKNKIHNASNTPVSSGYNRFAAAPSRPVLVKLPDARCFIYDVEVKIAQFRRRNTRTLQFSGSPIVHVLWPSNVTRKSVGL